MDKVRGIDQFGNCYTDMTREDGCVERCTQTNRMKEFEFLGDAYSWDYLRWLCHQVKKYEDESCHKIILYKDKYDRLLLYFYDKEIRFNNSADREDHLWVVVKNETDADLLAQKSRLARLREPYIAGDENNWMAVHQIITTMQNMHT